MENQLCSNGLDKFRWFPEALRLIQGTMNEADRSKIDIRMLIAAFAVTAVVAASWFIPGPWRDAWDWLDAGVFFTLNGMLKDNQPMAVFWALANNRAFDLVPALIFLVLFWRYMSYGGGEDRTLERVSACGLFVIYVLLSTQVLERITINFPRDSPSLVLDPAFRITEMVDWLPSKDSATQSFPGDHGTVSIMFSACLIHCFGLRAVWYGIGLVLLSTLPRLVSGAHWFTDIAVGSVVLALPILALTFATPLHAKLVSWIAGTVRRWLPWVDPFVRDFFSPATPPLVGKGVCMGTADIIPGVSGGTMAYILGIYERLLESITVLNRQWLRDLVRLRLRKAVSAVPVLFLGPLVFGIGLAVWIFTKMIPLPYFVQHHPEPVYGLFFGLVGGSVILLMRMHARLCWRHALTLLAGVALGITIVSLVPANTPDASWFIFLCGSLAISAMLLPGISGSFILLILGKYALILGAIGDLDLRVIIPFALGCAVGILVFAHSLKWLMANYTVTMNLLITGLLIGTLRAVWPFQERTYEEVRDKERLISSEPFWPDPGAWIGLAGFMMLLGFAIIYVLDRASRNKHHP